VPKREYQKELGEAIQALRKERGLKQQDLAKAAGVSVAQVSNVESGQFWPSVQTLIAFAEKLGVRDCTKPDVGP
jgi:transcriptional regulator with XRE-family HTH domain